MYLKKVISKKLCNLFFVGALKATDGKSRIQIRIRNPVYGSKDLDSSKNVPDPEHWKK
jgi:hypothetical protein